MLDALGLQSVDELFADIPESLRASPLKLDPPEAEQQLMARLSGLAARNRVELASFLGAGWMIKVKLGDAAQVGELLDAAGYEKLTSEA